MRTSFVMCLVGSGLLVACTTFNDASVDSVNGADNVANGTSSGDAKTSSGSSGNPDAPDPKVDPPKAEVPPKPDDGIKNGDETDVDCGGTKAPKCALAKGCAAHTDCTTDACSYAKKCIAENEKSCTLHAGGDTCGEGEMDEAGKKHESCCKTAELPSGTVLDKYTITAGRMRAFLERVKNNPRGWVEKEKPEAWPEGYPTSRLPENEDGVITELSHLETEGYEPRGCFIKGNGARTYFFSKEVNASIGDDPQSYPQDVYDSKALNCVRRAMATALCAFDGKELSTKADILEAYGPKKFPWGDQAWEAKFAVHKFTYEWPKPIAGKENEQVFNIAAPGRRPLGNGPFGHADIAGNLYQVVKDDSVVTGSFENHAITKTSNPWAENRKYYAGGFRCATHKK